MFEKKGEMLPLLDNKLIKFCTMLIDMLKPWSSLKFLSSLELFEF